jgi:hypothetical protein
MDAINDTPNVSTRFQSQIVTWYGSGCEEANERLTSLLNEGYEIKTSGNSPSQYGSTSWIVLVKCYPA